ncbi:MAG: tRNA epoxyqueuosine(34) reductase QueG, partial [Phycisphaeraceae bacterium]
MAGIAITAEQVKQRAADLGFTLSGIAPALASEHADHVRRWLAAGRHGSMAYLEKNLELRLSPHALLPGARTVISVADYLPPTHDRSPRQVGETPEQQSDKVGGVARYAEYDDYHRIIKKRLHRLADEMQALAPDEHFRACVDTAPVLEREHAARAGLGWVGKNTMLIHPQLGSHLMLGELLTTLELPPDTIESDHCGSCTRCIDACPTQCITP